MGRQKAYRVTITVVSAGESLIDLEHTDPYSRTRLHALDGSEFPIQIPPDDMGGTRREFESADEAWVFLRDTLLRYGVPETQAICEADYALRHLEEKLRRMTLEKLD